MNARYYSPNVGMFISADPAMDGANHYAYAGCNPVMYNDPTGMWTKDSDGNWVRDSSDLSILTYNNDNGGDGDDTSTITWNPNDGPLIIEIEIPDNGNKKPNPFETDEQLRTQRGSGGSDPSVSSSPNISFISPFMNNRRNNSNRNPIDGVYQLASGIDLDNDDDRISLTKDIECGSARDLYGTIRPGYGSYKSLKNLSGDLEVNASKARTYPYNGGKVSNNFIKNAITPGKGGVSPIGRALQKHVDRGSTFYNGATANNAKNTEIGSKYLDNILLNGSVSYDWVPSQGGLVIKIRLDNGAGVWWRSDGTLIGFLEPYSNKK
jgi:hypothetical protein